MRKTEIVSGNIDWITVCCYLLLVLIGWSAIYSATYSDESGSIFNAAINSGKQFQWILVSGFVAVLILVTDSRFFSTFAYIIYAGLMLLLLGVLFFGATINGSKSWIVVGSLRLQPAELGKFATSLALAKYLSGLNINLLRWKEKGVVGVLIGIPMLLVLLQGDTGSAIVFVSYIFMLYREGLESYYLQIGGALMVLSVLALLISPMILITVFFALAVMIAWFNRKQKRFVYFIIGTAALASVYTTSVDYLFNEVLKEHQRDRINVLIGKGGNDWNIRQSIIAIGSGGIFGKGYLNGTQTKLKFVPEQSTDFIFSSIGEEWGFAGSIFLIVLYMFFFGRIISLAEKQRSAFGRVYGYSVASILFFHFLINMGMAIGVAPVIGIPLPFISYGGSSLLAFTILLFVFIRLDSQRLEVFR
jgi:rod shape determining protein RodA